MGWAGIELDAAANGAARGKEAAIQSAGSRVRVQVIPVDEELVMVRAAAGVMGTWGADGRNPRPV
jgi:acetate kinase